MHVASYAVVATGVSLQTGSSCGRAGTGSIRVNLSLDAVPNGIDQDAVGACLRALPGVVEVHDLHIWGMSTTEMALTAHLVRLDADPDSGLVQRACEEVRKRFGIGHATFQIETPQMAHACELRSDNVV
jgi:cobalt-zinc-cadmium efflux system protein